MLNVSAVKNISLYRWIQFWETLLLNLFYDEYLGLWKITVGLIVLQVMKGQRSKFDDWNRLHYITL